MLIKYKNNIYNINTHYGVLEGKTVGIMLVRHDSNYLILDFETVKLRDAVLKMIWEKIVAEEKTFDIDKELEVIKKSIQYNV